VKHIKDTVAINAVNAPRVVAASLLREKERRKEEKREKLTVR
jgi:hypothetical protein